MTGHLKGMRRWLAAGVCACAIMSGAPVRAQTGTYHFNIPREDLGAALRAYGATSSTQVLFDGKLVQNTMSPALNGTYTPAQGLNLLLAGSNLTWRRTEAGVVLITAQTPAPAPAVPRSKPPVVHVAPESGTTEVVVKGMVRKKPADNTPPPLEVYAALPKYEQMALSPDGDGIAFLTTYDGAHYVVTYSLATHRKRAVKLSPGAISSISWADADHVLVTSSRTGLRGTCGSGPAAGGGNLSAGRDLADVSVDPWIGRERLSAAGSPGMTVLKEKAMILLDSLKIPDCAYFGVRSQNAVTSVNMAATTGTSLGEHLSENANLPLGTPQVLTLDGKPQLVGPFLELRAASVNRQATERVYLWKADPDTGIGKMIDDGGGDPDREHRYPDDWLLDHEGRLLARTVYDYESKRFAIEMRSGEMGSGGGWKPVLTRQIVHKTNTVAPYLAGPGRTDGSILIVDAAPGDMDKPGLRSFHYYELTSDGKTAGPLEPGDASQDRPVFDPKTGRLAGFVRSGESDSYSLNDAALRSLYQRAQEAVPGETVRIVATARDPRKMIIYAVGGEDPGSYYFVDFATGASTPIGEDYALLPSEWVASQSQVSYKAADGLEIQALLTLPPRPEIKNLPLVVLPHDGPQGHDTLGFNWLAQALASRGYLVLQPDYRGSDGHGPDLVAAGYGQWGRKMQSDLSDGVRDLVAQGLVDPRRVCIAGIGYGGYAALNGVAEAGTYRCAVSINGITDVASYKSWQEARRAAPEQDAITPLIPDPRVQRSFKVNPDSTEVLDAYLGSDAPSPAQDAGAISAPVLLVHETDDMIVPVQQSHKMRDALAAAGKPAELVEVAGKDHAPATSEARAEILRAVAAFLAKQNPAD